MGQKCIELLLFSRGVITRKYFLLPSFLGHAIEYYNLFA